MVSIAFRVYTLKVLDLSELVELKKTSEDPPEKQRLMVLEETLKQITK
jgi:hypothetical protein